MTNATINTSKINTKRTILTISRIVSISRLSPTSDVVLVVEASSVTVDDADVVETDAVGVNVSFGCSVVVSIVVLVVITSVIVVIVAASLVAVVVEPVTSGDEEEIDVDVGPEGILVNISIVVPSIVLSRVIVIIWETSSIGIDDRDVVESDTGEDVIDASVGSEVAR